MNKWRLPRKLKKKRKLLHLKWAVMYTEPMPLDKYLKEYPKTPDECFTWDIQKPKEDETGKSKQREKEKRRVCVCV